MRCGRVEDEHARTNHYAADAFSFYREVHGGADARSHTRASNIGVVTIFLLALIYVYISSLRTLPWIDASRGMAMMLLRKQHDSVHARRNP